jgi:hypothetical protein
MSEQSGQGRPDPERRQRPAPQKGMAPPPQGFPVQAAMQPPQPPKRHRGRNIVLGIIGVLLLIIIISAIANGGTKSQPTSAPASSSPASSSAPAPSARATVKVMLTARQRHFVKDIRAQFALTRSAPAIAAIGRQVCTLRRGGMRQVDVVAQLSVTVDQAAVTRLAERDLCRRDLPKPPRPKPASPPPAPSQPPPTTSAPQPAGCYPRASSGNCYEPGEFCPHADAGMTGVAGDGEKIICTDNNGLRWEPI